jgi:hypothetical protein
MILELAIAATYVAGYLLFLSGIFMSRMVLKDGLKWKDPIVFVGGAALLTLMLAAIAFETYLILNML